MISPAAATVLILQRTDATRGDHVGWPASELAAVSNWSGMLRAFLELLTAPVFPPAAHVAGEIAFAAAMAGAADFPAACQAYAVAMAGLPPPGIVATPPPAAPALPALPPTSDPVPPATSVGIVIDAWARSGTWTAGGPPAPWA